MYISENDDWIRYAATNDWKLSNLKDCGKWISYYKETSFAKEIINKALEQNVVRYAKHTKGASGVICFYVSGSNLEDHYRIISFMLDNNLIRLTKDISYFDISFKFNGQSWSKEYGNYFEGLLRLSDLIDLNSGQPLERPKAVTNFQVVTISKSRAIESSLYLRPLVHQLDQFLLTKFNKILQHKNESIDLNDKIIHLAPLGYNVTHLYANGSDEQFLARCALLIKTYLNSSDPKRENLIIKLKHLECIETNILLKLFEQNSSEHILITKFISFYNHSSLAESIVNSLSYLVYQSLLSTDKSAIEFINAEVNNLTKVK